MFPPSKEAAREIIDSIREQNGGITPADRENTPEGVLRALESIQKRLGAATQILATNIYSKDTRFIFELIQNAEDNIYTRALAAGEEPCLTFDISPGYIVIDCNEDGFEEKHVRALCSIAQSTKTYSAGYIGKKGIGFKSVFKVASKVKIQSGHFSFFFEHHHGDNGIGMIAPIYEDPDRLPEGVRTRFRLTMTNPLDFSSRVEDFRQLPDTMIMFLSKLKRITVNIFPPYTAASRTTYSYRYDRTKHLGKLQKVTDSGVDTPRSETVGLFHIAERTVSELPINSTRPSNQADVVLAFPVDDESVPIIKDQHVFAFLPLRKEGFSFLIQSDFITQASREDVYLCPRNEAILDGVAESFRDAVLQFCCHPTLQYAWMKYLPNPSISSVFWGRLLPKIEKLLQVSPILRPWSGGLLRPISQLRNVRANFLDQHGDPLLDDLEDEIYLSPMYTFSETEILKNLGLQNLTYNEIIERFNVDLRNPSPRLTASETDEDWHTRFAKVLLPPFIDDKHPQSAAWISKQKLIPLHDGQLVSATSGKIFYPEDEFIPIPKDLCIRLVHPDAVRNSARRKLFSELGVEKCVTKDVLKLIFERYNVPNAVNLESSVAHLRYLYWKLPSSERVLDERIYLWDQEGQPIYRQNAAIGPSPPVVNDLYFESEDEFGAQQLLKPTVIFPQDSRVNGAKVSGYPIHLLNTSYLEAEWSEAPQWKKSWKSWLRDFAGVRHFPRLTDHNDPSKLSPVFKYIIDCRPDKLVETLHCHWDSYSQSMNEEVRESIVKAKVVCHLVEDTPLEETYLPVQSLRKYVTRCHLSAFPFLHLPLELTDQNVNDWNFLTLFGVKRDMGTSFLLEVLRRVLNNSSGNNMSVVPLKLARFSMMQLYKDIAVASTDKDWPFIRKVFDTTQAIFVPSSGSRFKHGRPAWSLPSFCVWNGPDFLTQKHRLAATDEYSGDRLFSSFFQEILNVPNAYRQTYMQELMNAARCGTLKPEDIAQAYHCIWRELSSQEATNEVREDFEKFDLVYVLPQRVWVPPSSCLWTQATHIAGKYAIAAQYSQLKDFFVGKLRVETPNLQIYIQELKSVVHSDTPPDIAMLKAIIMETCTQLPAKGTLNDIRKIPLLPVQDFGGDIILESAEHPFAIVDRLDYGEVFQHKLCFLDFTLEEVWRLQPFLAALGLQDRYVSSLVKEISTAEDGIGSATLTGNFRKQAYGIFRVASHYHSPRARYLTLYHLLKEANIFESDRILTSLKMNHSGRVITAQLKDAKGNLHIEENGGQLNIFVPRDKTQQKLCFLNAFPKRLRAHLGIEDRAADPRFLALLNASEDVIDDILEQNGIIPVEGARPFLSVLEEQKQPATLSLTVSRGSDNLSSFSPNLPSDPSDTQHGMNLSIRSRTPSSVFLPGFSTVDSSSSEITTSPPQLAATKDHYRALLERIIDTARSASLPIQAAFHSNHFTSIFLKASSDSVPETSCGVQSESQLGHVTRIAAAGELYVFELLSHCLPDFTLSNWQSKIRHLVRPATKYTLLPSWNGAESSSIIYADTNHTLTDLLMQTGHLPSTLRWENSSPKYFIQVKTTTRGPNTPFYMTNLQQELMDSVTTSDNLEGGDVPIEQVYAIFHVFNLGQENIGLNVLVDPVRMRRLGKLNYSKVVVRLPPGAGSTATTHYRMRLGVHKCSSRSVENLGSI